MLPNFLCLGAQKAGTTTLWHLLDSHTDICMARPRETRFFSEPQRYAEGLPAYELRHFGHWRGERAVGEKCPEYLYLPEAAERVHASLGPDLKLLICLRSPAQRAYSHYRHNIVQLRESRSFEAVLADEAAADALPSPYGYLGRGRYAGQLERWFGRFGADRCHIISFDAIVSDQAAVAREMFAFLGVSPRPMAHAAVHAGHPPLEEMSLRVEGGAVTLVRPIAPAASQSWRARIRRKLGREPRTETVLIRNPSPALRGFAERIAALQPLPPALSRAEELRINRLYFAADLARLAPMVPFDIAAWLE